MSHHHPTSSISAPRTGPQPAAAAAPSPAGLRLDWPAFAALLPSTTQTLLAVGTTLDRVDPRLRVMASLLVSQRNRCDFCVAYHRGHARTLGVEERLLDPAAGWRGDGSIDADLRLVLTLAETLSGPVASDGALPGEVSDAVLGAVVARFGSTITAMLIASIALTTAWNRIARAYRFPEPA